MLKEVTDSQELFKVRIAMQNIPLLMDVNTRVELSKAWLLSDGWYRVQLTYRQGNLLWGILFIEHNEIYLDAISMLFLVEERIQIQLDAFNAGKHWRYKGL